MSDDKLTQLFTEVDTPPIDEESKARIKKAALAAFREAQTEKNPNPTRDLRNLIVLLTKQTM